MMKKLVSCAVVAMAAVEALVAGILPIEVDVEMEPIKDLRNSSSAPDLGYAGAMLETSTLVAEWFYISNRVESAKLIRDAGAWVVRPWSANDTWQCGLAWVATTNRVALQKRHPHKMFIDPHAYFSFWKENGMKAILCLENYGVYTNVETGARTSDIDVVKIDAAQVFRGLCMIDPVPDRTQTIVCAKSLFKQILSVSYH